MSEMPPCPTCGGELRAERRYAAKPVGAFSLSGAQMKFSAVESVWVVCACGFEAEGKPA